MAHIEPNSGVRDVSRTPNYRLKAEASIKTKSGDWLKMPQHSWLRPIELEYVPKHVLEDKRWQHFDSKREVFCYTKFGYVVLMRTEIEEA